MPPRNNMPHDDVIDADELERIIQQRVDDAMARALSQKVVKHDEVTPADHAWVQHLATSIAELSDQGTGRVRVAPAELEKREAARREMYRLLIEAVNAPPKQGPIYELRTKVFIGNRIIEPKWLCGTTHVMKPTVIEYRDVPCEPMIPQNDMAKAIYAAFRDSIGEVELQYGWKAEVKESYKFTPGGHAILSAPPQVMETQHTGNEARRVEDEFRAQLSPVTILTGNPTDFAPPGGENILGTLHSQAERLQ